MITNRIRPHRKRRSEKRSLVIIGALMLVLAFGFPAACRIVGAPWSIGLGGRDTLTGSWVGSMQARQGAEYGLYLDLAYRDSVARSRGRADNLGGRGTLCTRTGAVYEYRVSGWADRSGKVRSLRLEYGDPRLSGLNLRLDGKWRPGQLALVTGSNPFLPDGRFEPNRSVSSEDPDDSLGPAALQRGDRAAFEAICGRVQR